MIWKSSQRLATFMEAVVCFGRNDEISYLFTGDFLFYDGSRWFPRAKTRSKLENSLSLLKELNYDDLAGCGSDGVEVPYVNLANKAKKVKLIEEILCALKK